MVKPRLPDVLSARQGDGAWTSQVDAPIAVLTRPLDGQKMTGRLRLLIEVRAILVAFAPGLRQTVIQPLFVTRGPLRLLGALWTVLRHGLRGRWMPLQCMLYADPFEIARACAMVGPETSLVYLDGIRCYVLLEALRRRRPDLRIVIDQDDLMSRRVQLLLDGEQLPSAGYLSSVVPAVLDRILKSRTLARLMLRYEHAALVAVEQRAKVLADVMVLLSPADARDLTDRAGPDGVQVIPPAVRVQRPPLPLRREPIRFVFIGTDKLRQNQLTIDRLLAMWAAHRFERPLVIIGEQERNLELPPGVSAAGYVSTIDEVYDGCSVLLTPSYIAGGIKTKVLEAFSYGAPVIGNATTFEAMAIEQYPLQVDDEAELVELLTNPERHRDRLNRAAVHGAAYIATHHDPEVYAKRWRSVMTGA